MTWRVRGGAAAAVTVMALGLPGCTAEAPAPVAGAPAEAPSATVTVSRGDVTSVLVLDGVTSPQPEVAVRAGATGDLDILVEEGQPVTAGTAIGTVAGTQVVAPAGGVLVGWLVVDGQAVTTDLPVAVVRYHGFGVGLSVPAEDAYRLYSVPATGTTTITGGPGSTACQLLPSGSTSGRGSSPTPGAADGQVAEGVPGGPPQDLGGASGAGFTCLLPLEAPVVGGLPAKVGLQTARAEGVLLLPVEAVAGVAGTGVVTRVDGSSRSAVPVVLGVSDGNVVEIREGLAESDAVLAYAPGLEGRSP